MRSMSLLSGEGELMSLVKCPECHGNVSNRAPGCPNCGCPINGSRPNMWAHRHEPIRVAEVQFTRKWIKVLGVISLIAFWGGFYVQSQSPVGPVLLIGGLVGGVISSVAGWWHHA